MSGTVGRWRGMYGMNGNAQPRAATPRVASPAIAGGTATTRTGGQQQQQVNPGQLIRQGQQMAKGARNVYDQFVPRTQPIPAGGVESLSKPAAAGARGTPRADRFIDRVAQAVGPSPADKAGTAAEIAKGGSPVPDAAAGLVKDPTAAVEAASAPQAGLGAAPAAAAPDVGVAPIAATAPAVEAAPVAAAGAPAGAAAAGGEAAGAGVGAGAAGLAAGEAAGAGLGAAGGAAAGTAAGGAAAGAAGGAAAGTAAGTAVGAGAAAAGGAASGAAAGASAGSVVGPVGTAIGAIAGLAASYLMGGGFAQGGEVGGAAGHGPGSTEPDVLDEGLIRSDTAGRSDRLHVRAERGSYIIPADVVSGVGEGNTEAGGRILAARISKGSLPGGLARGGLAGGDLVEIRVSGGEFAVLPPSVARLGGGDAKRGAARLDQFIAGVRAHVQKMAAHMPGPK